MAEEIRHYRYRISRDIYKSLDLTPDSAEAAAIVQGNRKLLSGAVLTVNWTTGGHTWQFAKRVPPEVRKTPAACQQRIRSTCPALPAYPAYPSRNTAASFPGNGCRATNRNAHPNNGKGTDAVSVQVCVSTSPHRCRDELLWRCEGNSRRNPRNGPSDTAAESP